MHNSAFQMPQRAWAHPSVQLHTPARSEHSRMVTPVRPTWAHGLSGSVHTHTHMCARSPIELGARSPKKESRAGTLAVRRSQRCIGHLASLSVFWPLQFPSSAGNVGVLAHSEPRTPRGWEAAWFRDKGQGAGNVGPREGRKAHSALTDRWGGRKKKRDGPWAPDRGQHRPGCLMNDRHVPA